MEGSSRDTTLRIFQIIVLRRVRKIAKSDYQLRYMCLSIRPSVLRMEQLGPHLTDFHEI
jgi:hypothetical protein